MGMIDPLLQEFEHESSVTRKALTRVPDAELGWKPHHKSFSLGALASHLAEIPTWGVTTLDTTELVLDPGQYKPYVGTTIREILAVFDKNVSAAQARMQKATDAELLVPWSLKIGGKTAFSLPRIATLRTMVFNHAYHHRGQLTVYLRLKNIPVPSVYGPSADEPTF